MAGIDTLVFCTSFFRDQGTWESRYVRWLDHHLSLPWNIGAIAMIDDGSPFEPDGGALAAIPAKSIGRVPLPRKALIQFPNNLGRSGITTYPGWWRSFLFSLDIAESYGFRKIIHVESDTFLLTRSILRYVEQIQTGWTAFWTAHYQYPETALQVICADAFAAMGEIRDRGVDALRGNAAELILPFTNVEQEFVGDRYSEFQRGIPEHADYAVQVLPTMRIDKPSAPGRRLAALFADPLRGTIRPVAPPRFPDPEAIATLRSNDIQRIALLAANSALEHGDFASAQAYAERACAANPEDFTAIRLLVSSLLHLGRPREAVAAGRTATRAAPIDAALENRLGSAYALLGDGGSALGHFGRAIEVDPANLEALGNIRSWERAQGLDGTAGDSAEAEMRRVLMARLQNETLDERGYRTLLLVRDRSENGLQEILPVAKKVRTFRSLDAEEVRALSEIFAAEQNNSATARPRRPTTT